MLRSTYAELARLTVSGVFVLSVCLLPRLCALAEKPAPPREVRMAAVTQSWEKADRTLEHALAKLDEAAAEGAELICLPQECVPVASADKASAALAAMSAKADEHEAYVVANLLEYVEKQPYCTSYLIGPNGKTLGKYRKSHRMPDEAIALGDELPVFETPLGTIGLMIGTDHYWPEIPLVLALKGAEILVWSAKPEPVPQSFPLDVKMRVRAFDNHATVVCSRYAGSLPYLCSNHPRYAGYPLGCGKVIDPSGIIVAGTGWRPGVAVAQLDPGRGKDVYHLTFLEDRTLFADLVDPKLQPVEHQPEKRKIRVAIAQVEIRHQPNSDPKSPFHQTLDEAGRHQPDVILMAEFGFPTNTPEAEKTFALVAEKARRFNCYIVIGGLRDPRLPNKQGRPTSWAYMWDRKGKIVGEYRISQYGLSEDLPVFKTDFGVVGLILCGDIYSPEIVRAMALQGAELILCGSQSWGASGSFNRWMQQVRAIDNGLYMATAHFPMSDISQRSYVIDTYGHLLAASSYWANSAFSADIDLDAPHVWFAESDQIGAAGKPGYLAGFYPETVPQKRDDLRAVLFAGRRPELYGPIVEKSLADRGISEEVWEKMSSPVER